MDIINTTTANWFAQGGKAYAQFRPDYPPALASWLATIAPDRQFAADIGCGNGQLTHKLAAHFSAVAGFDPSAEQIANAPAAQNIRYQCAPAENIPLADNSASLITAAQAAHWFDLPDFYSEVRRIAAQDAVIALISYGVLQLEPELNERFQHFYYQEIGRYWPAQRHLVDTGYASMDFPFSELTPPAMEIKLQWNLEQLLGYISTWSATKKALAEGAENLLQVFAKDISAAWGKPEQKRTVRWPITMRVGTVSR